MDLQAKINKLKERSLDKLKKRASDEFKNAKEKNAKESAIGRKLRKAALFQEARKGTSAVKRKRPSLRFTDVPEERREKWTDF